MCGFIFLFCFFPITHITPTLLFSIMHSCFSSKYFTFSPPASLCWGHEFQLRVSICIYCHETRGSGHCKNLQLLVVLFDYFNSTCPSSDSGTLMDNNCLYDDFSHNIHTPTHLKSYCSLWSFLRFQLATKRSLPNVTKYTSQKCISENTHHISVLGNPKLDGPVLACEANSVSCSSLILALTKQMHRCCPFWCVCSWIRDCFIVRK